MFCHFLYKISAVILQNQNSWGRKGPFVPIPLLPLHHFLFMWMDCSWAWRRWSLKISQFSWSSLQERVSENSFKQTHEQSKVCICEVQGCDPAFCLTPFSQYPEFHYPMAAAVKATSRLNIPQQFAHACKYPDWLNCMLGSCCHSHVPATPCTAGALLCCPPIWNSSLAQNSLECVERPYRHWGCRKALCWPMQWVQYHRQMQYTKHKGIYSILLISQVTQTIILPLS